MNSNDCAMHRRWPPCCLRNLAFSRQAAGASSDEFASITINICCYILFHCGNPILHMYFHRIPVVLFQYSASFFRVQQIFAQCFGCCNLAWSCDRSITPMLDKMAAGVQSMCQYWKNFDLPQLQVSLTCSVICPIVTVGVRLQYDRRNSLSVACGVLISLWNLPVGLYWWNIAKNQYGDLAWARVCRGRRGSQYRTVWALARLFVVNLTALLWCRSIRTRVMRDLTKFVLCVCLGSATGCWWALLSGWEVQSRVDSPPCLTPTAGGDLRQAQWQLSGQGVDSGHVWLAKTQEILWTMV